MNRHQPSDPLDDLLRQWRAPMRNHDDEADFVAGVILAIRRSSTEGTAVVHHGALRIRLAVAAAVALLTLLLAWVQLSAPRHATPAANPIAESALGVYWQEIRTLFPNQGITLHWRNGSPELLLTDSKAMTAETPLMIRVCRNDRCEVFLTTSGHSIDIFGTDYDVLETGAGEVILVSSTGPWLPDETHGDVEIRLEARSLEAKL
ncbi:MAG TPA: hypothetical protein DCY13_18765 [Verrucomicrobiales bacterium]|nr:hypothetical protein [Verrucomicrobiales bacterium]